MTIFSRTTLLCALALASACSRTPERSPATVATADQRLVPASRARSAAEQIAVARCQRERECGNVGADETFSSAHDCLSRIQSDWKDDLSSRECEGGIDPHELDECLTEVRAESCDNPFDTLARISQCTRAQLCV